MPLKSGKVLIIFSAASLPNTFEEYSNAIEDTMSALGYNPEVSVYCLEHDGYPLWDSRGELQMIADHEYVEICGAGEILTNRIREVCERAHEYGIPVMNYAGMSEAGRFYSTFENEKVPTVS